jgi:hypothetical protein
MVSGFQILDIQSQVGHALWQIQALEKTLIHFIVLGFKVSRGADPLKAEEQFSVFDRFTLGRLTSIASSISSLSKEMALRSLDTMLLAMMPSISLIHLIL